MEIPDRLFAGLSLRPTLNCPASESRKQRPVPRRLPGRSERQIAGKPTRIGTAIMAEREHLLPFIEPRFDLAEVSFPLVDGFGCVRVRTNAYSVPLKAGTSVQVKVYSINGETVLDYDQLQDVEEGHIELQAHHQGSWTEFKHVNQTRCPGRKFSS
jgi:hypothetical protein